MKKKIVYVEPIDYVPEEIRKEFKLGEFAEENVEVEMKVTVETKDGVLNADGVEEAEKLLEALNK